MTSLTLVLSAAIAASPGRGQLEPDERRTIGPSAHVLDPGEIMVGTSGLHVGILPSVQVGTRPLLDAIEIPNAQIKIEAVRTKPLSMSVQGGGAAVDWGDLRGTAADAGATLTLTPSKHLSLHVNGRGRLWQVEGIPTEPPAVLADWLPVDSLQELGETASAFGMIPSTGFANISVRGAAEVRLNRRDSFLLQGGGAIWGFNQTDLTPGIDDQVLGATAQQVEGWVGSVGQAGQWNVSASWQMAFGNVDLRVGGGLSSSPGAWIGQANGLDVRAFGRSRREDRRLKAEAVAAAKARDAVDGWPVTLAAEGVSDAAVVASPGVGVRGASEPTPVRAARRR